MLCLALIEFRQYLILAVHYPLYELITHDLLEALDRLFAECRDEVVGAVEGGSDRWQAVYPGRRLLEEYARRQKLGEVTALRNSVIRDLAASPDRVPGELQRVVETIVKGVRFN